MVMMMMTIKVCRMVGCGCLDFGGNPDRDPDLGFLDHVQIQSF